MNAEIYRELPAGGRGHGLVHVALHVPKVPRPPATLCGIPKHRLPLRCAAYPSIAFASRAHRSVGGHMYSAHGVRSPWIASPKQAKRRQTAWSQGNFEKGVDRIGNP